MQKPLILVSNDDGITSRGILNLVNVMKELGEVLVVAPDSPQSGMGHAITVGDTLRLNEVIYFSWRKKRTSAAAPGRLRKDGSSFCTEREPPTGYVVSGVNHGSNNFRSAFSIRERCRQPLKAPFEGHQQSDFSLCDYSHDADFSHCLST